MQSSQLATSQLRQSPAGLARAPGKPSGRIDTFPAEAEFDALRQATLHEGQPPLPLPIGSGVMEAIGTVLVEVHAPSSAQAASSVAVHEPRIHPAVMPRDRPQHPRPVVVGRPAVQSSPWGRTASVRESSGPGQRQYRSFAAPLPPGLRPVRGRRHRRPGVVSDSVHSALGSPKDGVVPQGRRRRLRARSGGE